MLTFLRAFSTALFASRLEQALFFHWLALFALGSWRFCSRARRCIMGCGTSSAKGAGSGSSANGKSKSSKQNEKQAAKLENKEYQARMHFIQQVPLMKRLPK
ncbi:unnamed protein product, partial [Prorocentrum cordatum]